jgi:hypothetical protein
VAGVGVPLRARPRDASGRPIRGSALGRHGGHEAFATRDGFARALCPDTTAQRGRAALKAAAGKPSSVPSMECAPAIQAPARPAAPASQRVRKAFAISWRGPGIDGPSRPRRCPRPALWRGAGFDAKWRAVMPALLVVTDDHGAFGAVGLGVALRNQGTCRSVPKWPGVRYRPEPATGERPLSGKFIC